LGSVSRGQSLATALGLSLHRRCQVLSALLRRSSPSPTRARLSTADTSHECLPTSRAISLPTAARIAAARSPTANPDRLLRRFATRLTCVRGVAPGSVPGPQRSAAPYPRSGNALGAARGARSPIRVPSSILCRDNQLTSNFDVRRLVWPSPLELPIRSDVVGTSLSGILGFGVSPCASDRCRFAAGAPRGGTRAEGP
jgi:hypothetical protein